MKTILNDLGGNWDFGCLLFYYMSITFGRGSFQQLLFGL